jgi:uncharacterized protein YbjQ (UPF0145 family)
LQTRLFEIYSVSLHSLIININTYIMILTTTPIIQGHEVREYKGVVAGETIIAANVLKDVMANIRDFFGGRSSSYEKVLIEGREAAMRELEERARQMGANAVVGIHIEYGSVNQGTMLMIAATGTAVVIE